ncbi:MAG TPA: GDP-mannose 4,6-dehydratase [Gaiellaceae bacterium]|nr:GDP-mannose 4,6-dehydratase [Gaiellaceae bacterium]HET8653198.1 GDP-mannose 4,6-dehydratase [Gaiellaceae bacterium]
MARRALVTGIGGQDGSYLAEQLLGQGYELFGTVLGNPEQYEALAPLREKITFAEVELEDPAGVRKALAELEPDEIYHLASASFVPASWEDPAGTSTVTVGAVAALLDGIRREHPEARFVYAASGEIFGSPREVPQTESTPIAPLTPYGAGKAFGHFLTGAFRREYGLHASSAILFNHESPRRPLQFLTRKVTHGAAAISLGLEKQLHLGNLSAQRDWGFAGDYVGALRLMASRNEPDDFVIATGEAHTVEEFVAAAFGELGLDWREHVRYDQEFARGRSESKALVGDPTKAREQLGWEPEVRFADLVRMMVEADLESLKDQAASAR